MHTFRLLFTTSLAAILLGCTSMPGAGPGDELPSNNPTATSADLAKDA